MSIVYIHFYYLGLDLVELMEQQINELQHRVQYLEEENNRLKESMYAKDLVLKTILSVIRDVDVCNHFSEDKALHMHRMMSCIVDLSFPAYCRVKS